MNIICDKPLYFDELKAIYGESKPKIQIITHDDMDGYASAAVVDWAFKKAGVISDDNYSITHYNYSDKIPSCDQSANIIFITDYSISNEGFMKDLRQTYDHNKHKIFWCDHHQTSIDNCKGEYTILKNIPGIRDTKYCGAALAWFYLNPGSTDANLPKILRLVDDYDCWKKKIKESDWLNAAFNYNKFMYKKLHDPTSEFWKNAIDSGDYLEGLLQYGSDCCKIQKDLDWANIRRNGWIGVLDKFPDVKMICLNNDSKGSQLFSDLLKSKEYPNGKYTHACAFQFDGSKMVYSIYSAENASPNAQKICEEYGGGGHPGAAGFQSKSIAVKKIEEIPDNYK